MSPISRTEVTPRPFDHCVTNQTHWPPWFTRWSVGAASAHAHARKTGPARNAEEVSVPTCPSLHHRLLLSDMTKRPVCPDHLVLRRGLRVSITCNLDPAAVGTQCLSITRHRQTRRDDEDQKSKHALVPLRCLNWKTCVQLPGASVAEVSGQCDGLRRYACHYWLQPGPTQTPGELVPKEGWRLSRFWKGLCRLRSGVVRRSDTC